MKIRFSQRPLTHFLSSYKTVLIIAQLSSDILSYHPLCRVTSPFSAYQSRLLQKVSSRQLHQRTGDLLHLRYLLTTMLLGETGISRQLNRRNQPSSVYLLAQSYPLLRDCQITASDDR